MVLTPLLHRRLVPALACLVALCLVAVPRAQVPGSSLSLGLLERYLEALRVDFGVPGMAAAVIDDQAVWERGFGLADIGANVAVQPSTPFPVTGLTQVVASAVFLSRCVDSGRASLTDRVVRWTPFAEPTTTIGQLLSHLTPGGGYRYDTSRYAALSPLISECADEDFDSLLAGQVFDRFAMIDSVPGADAVDAPRRARFSSGQLARYAATLRRVAVPYRVPAKGAATRSEFREAGVTTSSGVISSVRDLAQFDLAANRGLMPSAEASAAAWTVSPGRPTGLGWFTQSYNGQAVAWQFGVADGAYSSLVVKLPARRLTLVLLANSDQLASALNTAAPDVTQSVFARTFLRLFVS
jgi:CubicO group peptidase (beta-lactamase class C family)